MNYSNDTKDIIKKIIKMIRLKEIQTLKFEFMDPNLVSENKYAEKLKNQLKTLISSSSEKKLNENLENFILKELKTKRSQTLQTKDAIDNELQKLEKNLENWIVLQQNNKSSKNFDALKLNKLYEIFNKKQEIDNDSSEIENYLKLIADSENFEGDIDERIKVSDSPTVNIVKKEDLINRNKALLININKAAKTLEFLTKLNELEIQHDNIKAGKEKMDYDCVDTPLYSLALNKIWIIKEKETANDVDSLFKKSQELEKLHGSLVKSINEGAYKDGTIMLDNIEEYYNLVMNLDTINSEDRKEMEKLWKNVKKLEEKFSVASESLIDSSTSDCENELDNNSNSDQLTCQEINHNELEQI